MRAEEITSKGIPFQTAVFPPPRKVGTPDSAETPAPVNTNTLFALRNRSRSSREIEKPLIVCIERWMVTERGGKVSRNANCQQWLNLAAKVQSSTFRLRIGEGKLKLEL